MLEYWLWISGAENVSPRAKALLLRHYGGAESAYFAPAGEFYNIDGVSEREAGILERRDMDRARQIADECARQDVGIITMQDAAYPQRLRNIFLPPPVIYVKGALPPVDENALVAVIGTRRASPYGLKMGRDIAYQISRCGGIVVSLLTEGIDTQAARGALTAGGKCVAVLGAPHEREQGPLIQDVQRLGAAISEYPPGTTPRRNFFRERNRIAAGLSVGVVVVEAPEKSGTRLFAMEALEQGKEIFAVPGNADAENSAGTLALIKEGARLVTNGAEVMEEFEGLYMDRVRPVPPRPAPAEPGALDELGAPDEPGAPDELGAPDGSTAPDEPAALDQPAPAPAREDAAPEKPGREREPGLEEQLASLTADQLKIIAAIDKDAAHIDDIIETTGLPTATVLAQLTLLEIRGFVRRQAGRRVTLNTVKK